MILLNLYFVEFQSQRCPAMFPQFASSKFKIIHFQSKSGYLEIALMKKKIILFLCGIHFVLLLNAQNNANQGSLFIIGGGDRPPEFVKQMVEAAQLKPSDHIAILTMSSAEPDTSYAYIKADLMPHCKNTIAMLHFTKDNARDKIMLDSLRSAKFIFITGGVQSRFMDVVLHTPIYDAIHEAYRHGSMIAGTSAGAAVMSKEMITGDQIRKDTIYSGSVDRIIKGNIQIAEGLGMITTAIIDQHFVVRSRYNRLLTVLNQYPDKICIGIDEETAILVKGNSAKVFGSSQVIILKQPTGMVMKPGNVIRMKEARISILTAGDSFTL
jgi:cyanophycinase